MLRLVMDYVVGDTRDRAAKEDEDQENVSIKTNLELSGTYLSLWTGNRGRMNLLGPPGQMR